MDTSKFDYQSELQINPDALDVEWIIQPSLFVKYAEALALARKELDAAKADLEMCKADIDNEIRQNPIPYTGSDRKPTETQIANLVLQHPDVQNCAEMYVKAKGNVEILSVAVKAFEHKKVALENLVKLHGQQYFAGPTEPRNISDIDIDSLLTKQKKQRIASKLNRHKRNKEIKERQ